MFLVENISIGNELLSGFTINTNASWLGKELLNRGYFVKWGTTIPDEEEAISEALSTAQNRADIVLITGGLGPTLDDITKKVVSSFFDMPLQLNEKALQSVKKFFEKRKRPINEIGLQQAYIPSGAEALTNTIGTASGIAVKQGKVLFIFMPGVPSEMKSIMNNEGFEFIARYFPAKANAIVNFKTTGIYESRLSELLSDLIEQRDEGISVAFLPRFTGVTFRLIAPFEKKASLEQFADKVRAIAGEYIFSEDEDELEDVVGQLLLKKKKTVAVAESCSGGLISHMLTNTPGSSAYTFFNQVTYSNEAKIKNLQIPEKLLLEKGAVDPEVAIHMAESARNHEKTDFGIGVTGIAGPDGGTDEKPVGLVFVALSGKNMETVVKKYLFGNDRKINKLQTAVAALEMLRRALINEKI